MISIVIDQTSVKNDLTLCVCQISQLKVQFFEFITYNISFDHIRFLFYCFSHIRNKDVISVLEGKCFMIFFCQEWKHSPVDQV